jgi:ABC-type multidrug transport system ATPase subunit
VTPAISVSELTKSYGEIEAVRGIDFEVAAGETFGFLGPNGAGKSTTIKILCTLADPTSGTARVLTYIVSPMRHVVFSHLSVGPLATTALSPGITWFGWEVPLGLSLAMVAVMGAAMLGIGIAEFRKTE